MVHCEVSVSSPFLVIARSSRLRSFAAAFSPHCSQKFHLPLCGNLTRRRYGRVQPSQMDRLLLWLTASISWRARVPNVVPVRTISGPEPDQVKIVWTSPIRSQSSITFAIKESWCPSVSRKISFARSTAPFGSCLNNPLGLRRDFFFPGSNRNNALARLDPSGRSLGEAPPRRQGSL